MNKRVFPVVWFGFLAVFAVTAWASPVRNQPPAIFLVPVFMAIIGYVVMRQLVFDLVDQVWDDGDALLIRNGNKEERVALKNIINVSYSRTSPPRVTLTLREPCRFGKEVTFSPPYRFFHFTAHPIVAELIERIDEQRRSA